jgi:hypothetical protein
VKIKASGRAPGGRAAGSGSGVPAVRPASLAFTQLGMDWHHTKVSAVTSVRAIRSRSAASLYGPCCVPPTLMYHCLSAIAVAPPCAWLTAYWTGLAERIQ